ncbi:sodium-translocating pyrophosphatase [Pelagicoccus mobilis]|uniref:Putative K(+)-stimulated pyrophosphate-energized sodium pump n=1 Tax=Pelagicoccus mobilis TaxID=415221 RepID=A0A934VTX7_9BACT|nr:sodium-translocating pyrophosphatase [Pelagicoccus mobilis]MBK1879964.1 sodium-translocating pyrophosphatase [Pelagicoccus mobilis]
MTTPTLFWIAPGAALVSLAFAYLFFRQLQTKSEGTERMREIAGYVSEGARAYLKQQYKIVAFAFIILTALFAFLAYQLHAQNPWTPVIFVSGGLFSGLAGYFGMKTATAAASRTAQAASESLNNGLRIAFRSGAVMGLSVVGLGLLAISIWFVILVQLHSPSGKPNMPFITTALLAFGMGASLQALFARVGGGIYTKAADVGADLVGKVEAGIPEDDPRNPATIADNVGDFVGDVAGMGADLYESYCGSILATAALGAAAFAYDPSLQIQAAVAPMVVAGIGIVLSVIGIYLVQAKKDASQKSLLHALDRGVNFAAIGIAVLSIPVIFGLGLPNGWGIWTAIVIGLIAGIAIGKATEYYTSSDYGPTLSISENAETGPATVIIAGLGTGMISTYIAVFAVCISIIFSYSAASGFDLANMAGGLYGIGFAAVGMLSTLGVTLATDAYGPIADNAGGNAEMSGLPSEVRQRTDALDSLGNTTAAIGKGFAIGSAALTAMALMASYVFADPNIDSYKNANELLLNYINTHELHLLNPRILIGLFIGSLMAFLFCGLTMNAVGRTAKDMVEEVRRQFAKDDKILKGESTPDYASCVSISTQGAQREMLTPALIAIAAPVCIGLLFGPAGVIGLLVGGLATGFVLAVFMANSGGSWDNAKKFIEEGNHGGKGSAAHKAAVIGDTVGDPFKDTSGPSLNILIKLMTMVSIVTAGLTLSYSLF